MREWSSEKVIINTYKLLFNSSNYNFRSRSTPVRAVLQCFENMVFCDLDILRMSHCSAYKILVDKSLIRYRALLSGVPASDLVTSTTIQTYLNVWFTRFGLISCAN